MDGKPPANNAAPPPPQDAAPGNDFSNVIETILNAAELRDSSPPLWYKEISQLSMLCELQSSRKGGIADDLGFADVDPDLIVSLMETLEKHVASASSVEIHKEAMAALMGKKQKYSVEQVSPKQ